MSHHSRWQRSTGAIIVGVNTLSRRGLGVMLIAQADEPDSFILSSSRSVLLAPDARSIAPTFGAAADKDERIANLLDRPLYHQPSRRYSSRRLLSMLSRPIDSWRWHRRGTVLYRLDMTWALCESTGDKASLELLKSQRPLGELAELCYETLDDDRAFQRRLAKIDLSLALHDGNVISRAIDNRTIVAN